MVWKMKLAPPDTRPRRRVRDLAKDLEVPVEHALALLADMGEFVSSPSAFVEEPVVAKLYDQCDHAYVSQTMKHAPGWNVKGSGCRIGPPAPHTPQTQPLREPRQRHTSAQEGDRWAAGLGQDASDAFAYQSWKLYQFSDAERDVWIDAGLRPGQAKAAAALRDAGLRPTDLQKVISGWTVMERVTRGEGAQSVARLLKAAS